MHGWNNQLLQRNHRMNAALAKLHCSFYCKCGWRSSRQNYLLCNSTCTLFHPSILVLKSFVLFVLNSLLVFTPYSTVAQFKRIKYGERRPILCYLLFRAASNLCRSEVCQTISKVGRHYVICKKTAAWCSTHINELM